MPTLANLSKEKANILCCLRLSDLINIKLSQFECAIGNCTRKSIFWTPHSITLNSAARNNLKPHSAKLKNCVYYIYFLCCSSDSENSGRLIFFFFNLLLLLQLTANDHKPFLETPWLETDNILKLCLPPMNSNIFSFSEREMY